MYQKILEPIVQSPQLPTLLKELQQFWEKEQVRRTAFYEWLTPAIKAEFIEGEIIIHSPVRSKHNVVLSNIAGLLRFFVVKYDLGYIGIEKIMCRFLRNDYEPDMVFFDAVTSKEITDEQTIFPVPQLIVEVLSKSTESRDRGVKFQDYESHGVAEYWIVDAYKNIVEQYVLENKEYVLQGKLSEEADIQSKTIPNLNVPVKAFFDSKITIQAIQKMAGSSTID